MNKKQIKEFLKRLKAKEGCNFREVKGEIIWTCDGIHYSWTLSRKIMNKMKIPFNEQFLFLTQCVKYGGYCDCEILFNSEEKLLLKKHA